LETFFESATPLYVLCERRGRIASVTIHFYVVVEDETLHPVY